MAHIFRPDFIIALQEQFGFVKVPAMPSEVLGETLFFEYGKVESGGKSIIVRELRISPEWVALSAEPTAGGTTDEAELALKEIADWATERFNIPPQQLAGAYGSQLEVQLEFHFALAFPMLAQLGVRVANSFVDSRGQAIPPLEVVSIGMGTDPLKVQIATPFSIERRAGFPYEANIFFSQAPLKTSEHIAALEELEGVMKTLETLRVRPTATPNEPSKPSSQ
jgi:hypothetical protein